MSCVQNFGGNFNSTCRIHHCPPSPPPKPHHHHHHHHHHHGPGPVPVPYNNLCSNPFYSSMFGGFPSSYSMNYYSSGYNYGNYGMSYGMNYTSYNYGNYGNFGMTYGMNYYDGGYNYGYPAYGDSVWSTSNFNAYSNPYGSNVSANSSTFINTTPSKTWQVLDGTANVVNAFGNLAGNLVPYFASPRYA